MSMVQKCIVYEYFNGRIIESNGIIVQQNKYFTETLHRRNKADFPADTSYKYPKTFTEITIKHYTNKTFKII